MNKFRVTIKPNDTQINLPIEIDFDGFGRNDLIEEYEQDILEQVINPPEDFETTRYSHDEWLNSNTEKNTSTTYGFYFFDRDIEISATTPSNQNLWVSDYKFVTGSTYPNYSGICFSEREVYYYANSFKRSFFKLDFYDTPNSENQKLYFTVIIPTQQGRVKTVNIGSQNVPREVNIRIPTFDLDFTGDKEGYFIYWLKSREYIPNNDFYMSAKFFNAKVGQFIRMTNRPQCVSTKKFNFNKEEYFYYKVMLDPTNYVYNVYSMFGNQDRVGTLSNPINWYEYVNPE